MQKSKLNNVIVLKELSSNIVEEAIVFLKPNVNIKENEWLKINNDNNKSCLNKENTILKEAENIIEEHIKQLENKEEKEKIKNFEKKYKRLKKISIILLIINIFCILKIL